ncbi:unnamed protein product, partial [Allacma fusca]
MPDGARSSADASNSNSKSKNKSPAPTAPNAIELNEAEYISFIRGEGRVYTTSDPAMPMSPDHQLRLMAITAAKHDKYVEPTARDLRRYEKYIQSIPDEEVLPWPIDLSSFIRAKIPSRVLKIPRRV